MTDSSGKQRYLDAKAIAHEALELDPSRRQSLIEARCEANDALKQEVEWLIEAAEDDAADDVPERFQAAARDALQEVSFEVPLPRNYRLLERISQGGMGIVYLAERIDGDLRQPVAFKLLHLAGSDDEALARRFSSERGILSRLNHPCIARLVDGGWTAEGRPFLATEFVEGERIDRWAAAGVSRAAVLDVFVKVCEAVDYAHRRMVIHGDLKPANILVTRSGTPKLLDFGVARMLESDEQEGEALERGMTLAYASPEQIRGETMSAGTDVYALGVLLHELLFGAPPFDRVTGREVLREQILSGRREAARARDGLRLPSDLQAIIDKAMQVDEDDRYESVQRLLEDVRRFQTHFPVRARGGGILYRGRRFARRHRVGVTISVATLVALVVFQVNREIQLDRIAWERDRAEAVTGFVSGLLAETDSLPTRGNDVTVRDILDLGKRQLAETEGGNPAALGQMYVILGEAYNALGLGEQALPLLERALDVLGDQLQPVERARIRAQLGAAYDSAGRAAEAIAADERAIELFKRSPEQHPREVMRLRIRRLRNQGNVLEESPLVVIDRLEAILEELDGWDRQAPELLFEARAALVGARVAAGQESAALGDAVRARELAESIYDEYDPRRLRGRYVHATAMMLRNPESAVDMFESLIADHERLVGPGQRLANTIGNLGVALSRLGRNRESMAAFERAARMIESTVGRNHYFYRLSTTNLAALHLRTGSPERAEKLVRDILPDLERLHESVGGIETFYLVSAMEVLGGAQVMQDQSTAAMRSYREALQVLDSVDGNQWSGLRERIAGKLAEITRS